MTREQGETDRSCCFSNSRCSDCERFASFRVRSDVLSSQTTNLQSKSGRRWQRRFLQHLGHSDVVCDIFGSTLNVPSLELPKYDPKCESADPLQTVPASCMIPSACRLRVGSSSCLPEHRRHGAGAALSPSCSG